MGRSKPVGELSSVDLDEHPVWEFVNSEDDETLVRPVLKVPVSDLQGKVVGTTVYFANGRPVRAILGNIDLQDTRRTQHFLTVSMDLDGRWLHLARYHDPDFQERGPKEIAIVFGLSVEEVYPILYDIREHVVGELKVVSGNIMAEPQERLTRAELINLSVS
jgi:hypothetical protein